MSSNSLLRTASAFAMVVAIIATAHGQPSQPDFEVASFRMATPYSQAELNSGGGHVSWSDFPTHRFYAHHVTLTLLLALAYGVQQKYIDGVPSWAEEQNYNIDANVEGDQSLTYEQMKPLIQQLIEQRLRLAAHVESRQTPGFALVINKGKPKLTPSPGNAKSTPFIFRDRLVARGADLSLFADLLGHSLGDPVLNQTGITGNYDFDLHFHPANDQDSNLPDEFTAVQEQLGLKLVPAKVPGKYVVVDHVERVPTEN